MKFNRRHLLLAGLGAGGAVASAKEHLRVQAVRKQQNLNTLARVTLTDSISIMEAAYASEADWEDEVANRRRLLSSSNLTPPTQTYNRELSKLLIRFCKLAVQQYRTGRANPNYDGAIDLLPAYHSGLKDYTQLTNFTSTQEIIEDYFKNENLPIFSDRVTPSIPMSGTTPKIDEAIQENDETIIDEAIEEIDEAIEEIDEAIEEIDEAIEEIELTIQDRVRQILQREYRITVYSGMALTSKEHNILVFRGTQTQAEWLNNLNAAQQPYISPSGLGYGDVHQGFLEATQQLQPSLSEVAQQLDPTIPCYVTGHSLGAAIATLAAFEMVQASPQLKDQIQLYTYAGPRVVSPAFAKRHSQLIPNAYRVVNLADSVPLVPPVNLGSSYVHIGQEWSFIAQFGDVLLNHVVDTYQAALEQEDETDQVRTSVKRMTS